LREEQFSAVERLREEQFSAVERLREEQFSAVERLREEQFGAVAPDLVGRTPILRRPEPFSGKESSCLLRIHRSSASERLSWLCSAVSPFPDRP
jgi:hypothetical protein